MKIKKKEDAYSKKNATLNTKSKRWILAILLMLALVIILPVTIIILIGLLPTITILITDPKNSSKVVTVGCFNMAGLFVYVLSLVNNFSVGGAFNIVADIFNLIIMLGSAGIGLILYCELPNMFSFFSKLSAQKRLESIDAKLAEIAEEWGQEIIDEQVKTLR